MSGSRRASAMGSTVADQMVQEVVPSEGNWVRPSMNLIVFIAAISALVMSALNTYWRQHTIEDELEPIIALAAGSEYQLIGKNNTGTKLLPLSMHKDSERAISGAMQFNGIASKKGGGEYNSVNTLDAFEVQSATVVPVLAADGADLYKTTLVKTATTNKSKVSYSSLGSEGDLCYATTATFHLEFTVKTTVNVGTGAFGFVLPHYVNDHTNTITQATLYNGTTFVTCYAKAVGNKVTFHQADGTVQGLTADANVVISGTFGYCLETDPTLI